MFYLYRIEFNEYKIDLGYDDLGRELSTKVDIKEKVLVATFSSYERAERYANKILLPFHDYAILEVLHDPT